MLFLNLFLNNQFIINSHFQENSLTQENNSLLKTNSDFNFFWNQTNFKNVKIKFFAPFNNGLFFINTNNQLIRKTTNNYLKKTTSINNIKQITATKNGRFCFLLTNNYQLSFFDANLNYTLVSNQVVDFKIDENRLYFLKVNNQLFVKNLSSNQTKKILGSYLKIFYLNNYFFALTTNNYLLLNSKTKNLFFKIKKTKLQVVSFKLIIDSSTLKIYIQDFNNNLFSFQINNLKVIKTTLIAKNVSLFALSKKFLVYLCYGNKLTVFNFKSLATKTINLKIEVKQILATNNKLFFIDGNKNLFAFNFKNFSLLFLFADLSFVKSFLNLNFIYFLAKTKIGIFLNNHLVFHQYHFVPKKTNFFINNLSLFFLNDQNDLFTLNFKILNFLNLNNNERFENGIHYYLKNQVFNFSKNINFIKSMSLNNHLISLKKTFTIDNINKINYLKITFKKQFLFLLNYFFDLNFNNSKTTINLKIEIITPKTKNIFKNKKNCYLQNIGVDNDGVNLKQLHIINSNDSFLEIINLGLIPIVNWNKSRLYSGILKNNIFVCSKIFDFNNSQTINITKKHLYKLVIINLFNQTQTYYINALSTTLFNFNVNNDWFKFRLKKLKLRPNFKLTSLNQKQENLLSKHVNKYYWIIIDNILKWIVINKEKKKFKNLDCWNFLLTLSIFNIPNYLLLKKINLNFDFSYLKSKQIFDLNQNLALKLHQLDTQKLKNDWKLLKLEKIVLPCYNYSLVNINQILKDSINYHHFFKNWFLQTVKSTFLNHHFSLSLQQKTIANFNNNLFFYCQKTNWNLNFKNNYQSFFNFNLLKKDILNYAYQHQNQKVKKNNLLLIIFIVLFLITLIVLISLYRYRHKIKYFLNKKHQQK